MSNKRGAVFWSLLTGACVAAAPGRSPAQTPPRAPLPAAAETRRYAIEVAGLRVGTMTATRQPQPGPGGEVVSTLTSDVKVNFLLYHLKIYYQVINRTRLDVVIPESEQANFGLAKNIVRFKLPRSRRYLVTTFFYPPLRKGRTTLVPPILRPEILAAQPSTGDFVLVYQSATTQHDLVAQLQELPEQTFRVYGFNKEESHGNVQLCAFSEAGFIADLAACRAVLTNGGFSLISEAVYLHKPVCAVPIPAQFEQWLNAAEIAKCGYGVQLAAISAAGVRDFLSRLPAFAAALAGYAQDGNALLFAALETELAG